MDMTMILGSTILPKGGFFKRILKPNETDNVTLGGKMYTDFRNQMREWEVTWESMKYSDFQSIYSLFSQQYENNAYHIFRFDAFNINVPAKIEVSDQDIVHNGVIVKNFTLIIKEQNAFS